MIKKATYFEFIWLLFILVICFRSSISFTNLSLISLVFSLFVFPMWLIKRKNKNALPVFCLFIFILIWALLTTAFHDYYLSKQYIVLPILFGFTTIFTPFIFSKLVANNAVDYKKHLFKISVIITCCTVIYAFYYYSHPQQDARLATPIGGAAVIHVCLLLTLTVYFAHLKIGKKKLLSSILSFATILLMVLAGSRIGFATILILLLSIVFNKKNIGRSIGIIIFLAIVGYVVFKFLPTDRLSNFNDPYRSAAYSLSWKIATQSLASIIFGTGYGVVWPWYAYSVGILHEFGLFISTQFGALLVHPHSVFLGLFAELGLIGLIPFLVIIIIIIKHFFTNLRNGDQFNSVILYGIICTIPSFALDYYLFYNHKISLLWWYFVFTAISVNNTLKKEEN